MTFRIAHISDTHLSGAKPFFTENFQRIGEAIAEVNPDLVLNSGDISLDGASNEDDLATARALHDEWGLPMRFLPGNHDLGDNHDSPGHGQHPISAERRARYVRHFGPDWWALQVPGWCLLGINAQLLGSDLKAAREQELFIEAVADMLGSRRLALLLHKPLFDGSAAESEITGRFVNPAPRRRLLERLGNAAPSLVVCGHVHQFRESWAGSTRHVWGTSTGFVIPDRRQPRYGLKEVGYVEHRLHADGAHDSEFIRVAGAPTLDIADFPEAYGPV